MAIQAAREIRLLRFLKPHNCIVHLRDVLNPVSKGFLSDVLWRRTNSW